MNPCDEYVFKTLRYLENDLEGKELEDFQLHLESCAECRAHLEAETSLSRTLHRSRPLYSASAALRDRVDAAVSEHSASGRSLSPVNSEAPRAVGKTSRTPQRLVGWQILAPVGVVLALCLAIVPETVRHVKAASYVEAAVETHRSFLNGNLPSGLQSNSPEAVTAWLAGKVPFNFRLPASESVPEENPAYRLTGTALVNYKGSPAAVVMYATQNDKITLLVDSSSSAVVAGGDEVRSAKLTFHYHNEASFRVITWTNHGLSYALVSSVSGPARRSCLVCHQSMADRSDFKDHREPR